ncbi:hypothetical protein KVR01_009828 [Diaporthe batatas]|uniref:uncharacterized protein n=1 Tax=Diaporthe batatas TaxID=748121 RepID=UPI001D052F68|nr:uncharacterized protein KVR01_009828 [Diaporthe batatas]KAG8160292.1 hypothetical protein KVR01_009828 [Diaporthe batatas]
MSRPRHAQTKPQRDPPPSLFLQPSPAASHVSLPSTVAGPGRTTTGLPPTSQAHPRSSSTLSHDPLAAALSTLSKPMDTRPGRNAGPAAPSTRRPAGGSGSGALGAGGLNLPPIQTTRRESTRATDRTDALWAEMQATLEEVELSASGGTRVFGPEHDRKLGELRAAQIALAQAWARSEADEAIETSIGPGTASERGGAGAESKTDGTTAGGAGAGIDGAARSAGTASVRPGSAGIGAERLGQKLEEETEIDIKFARKRREANDRYFQRVNQGVLDVVAKLEDVATAMRAVEQESKDVWGEMESVPSSAVP